MVRGVAPGLRDGEVVEPMSAVAVAEAGAPAEAPGGREITFAAAARRVDWQAAMRIAWRVNRSRVPILENVHLEARASGELVVRAGDDTTAVRTSIPAEVAEPGSALVPGRLLSRALRALPPGLIQITARGDGVSLAGAAASVGCTPAGAIDDYPALEPIVDGSEMIMESDELATILRACLPMCTLSTWWPKILTGVAVSVVGGRWEFAAADGFRLAIAPGPPAREGAPDAPLVLGAAALRRLGPVLRGEPREVTIRWNAALTRYDLAVGDTLIQGALIQGTFPAYRQLIPAEHAWQIQLPAAALAAAVRMILIAEPAGVRLTFAPDTGLELRSLAAIGGEIAEARLLAGVTVMAGAVGRVALNPYYLLEALQMFPGDVVITGMAPDHPVALRAPDGTGPMSLVMPMAIAWDA